VQRVPLAVLAIVLFVFSAIRPVASATPSTAPPPLATTVTTVSASRDKLGALAQVAAEYQRHRQARSATPFVPSNALVRIHGDAVLLEAVAQNDAGALRRNLEALGLRHGATWGRVVSGWLPLAALEQAAALNSLRFAQPVYARSHAGRITSQGDQAIGASQARTSGGASGRGVVVGVLSDSYDCLGGAAQGVLGGDLPPSVTVLAEYSTCTDKEGRVRGSDEGRAMLEIVHDVAPGATLAFHSAFNGQADFAQGIVDLADAGADVIVDDVIYLAEPMFQDGIVAQAVDQVAARGVVYVSSAGNSGRDSYESEFRPSDTLHVAGRSYAAHDFDPGSGTDTLQRLDVAPGTNTTLVLQWDTPYFSVSGPPGAQSDLDMYLLDAAGQAVIASSAFANLGHDPVEVLRVVNTTAATLQLNLVVGKRGGISPTRFKYVVLDEGVAREHDTRSSTAWGHPNARGAIAVGAALYSQTPMFGSAPMLRPYSSAGGVPILFEPHGARKAEPELRLKPELVAPDGVNTTFFPPRELYGSHNFDREGDGFPNFDGTSAAAPHVAAVVALLREADPALTPAQLRQVLDASATDMLAPGFDFDSGAGLVRADVAMQQVLRAALDEQIVALPLVTR
jgi:subtilisin family serine protease